MASLVNENASLSRFQNRPMMLKDFLRDDCVHTMYPCRSSALISSKSNEASIVLLRSRSRKAAATTISAINKVINVVKFFHFASVKSPSVNVSRKIHKGSKDKNDILGEVSEVKVKVKDILRWKSFRDMVEDNSTPIDLPSSPNRSTTTDAISSCSKSSSWCESDFTEEELSRWGGENEELWGKTKKRFPGQPPSTNAEFGKPKTDWIFEESEQQSPISVFDDSPFREAEEPISPYHPNLANLGRARCILERMQELESVTQQKTFARKYNYEGEIANCGGANAVEEKAKKLLSHLGKDDGILLDFFIHEVSMNGKLDDVKFDCEILRIAKSWINGEFDEYSYEWEWEDKREAYVKDMEKGMSWNKFKQEEEEEEMSKELEVMLWDDLIDELSADFFLH